MDQQKQLDSMIKKLKAEIAKEMGENGVNSVVTEYGKITISERVTNSLDTTKVKNYLTENGIINEYMRESKTTVFTATPSKKD